MIKLTLVKTILQIQSFKSENSCIWLLLHHHCFNHLPLIGYFRCFSLTTARSYIVYILFLSPVIIVMLANPIIFYQAGKSGTQPILQFSHLVNAMELLISVEFYYSLFFFQSYWIESSMYSVVVWNCYPWLKAVIQQIRRSV